MNHLPIVRYSEVVSKLSEFLHFIKDGKEFDIFFEVVNAAIFELYFEDHMQTQKIDVLQFIEQDISTVLDGKEFIKLSNPEKEKIIKQLHERWSDPENEVRKRIDSFPEKSPDILKPILEG